MIMALGWKAFAGGVVLLGSALGTIGLGLPQIATEEDLKDLSVQIAQVDLMSTQQALESAELRVIRLEREAKARQAEGENTDSLDGEVRILKRRTRGLEARVLKLMQPKD